MLSDAMKVVTKESREMMRDKRVRTSALIGPFLLVFMMMYSFGSLTDKISNKKNLKVYVVQSQIGNPIIDSLKSQGANVIAVASVDKAKKLVMDGTAPLVLNFPQDFIRRVQQQQPATIDAIYDERQERSQMVLNAVQTAVDDQNKKAVVAILRAHGLAESAATPLEVKPDSVSRPSGVSEILIAILPYFIIFWAFIGGVSAAADLVAGEKERNTLETLLISPAPRTQIILGKFLALGALCLASSLSGLLAIFVAANSHMTGMNNLFKNGTGVGPMTFLEIFAVLLPTVCFFASVLIAISTFARNSREAQTYLSLASFAVAFPAISSQFIGFSDAATSKWINLVPVLNASAAVRGALLGTLDATSLLLTTGTSTVLAIISIVIAVKLFNREEVLLRV